MSSVEIENKSPLGLYFHVPFCNRKCPYCDFYSVKSQHELTACYTEAVIRNIKKYRNVSVDSIYFGGGTPSTLSGNSYNKIFEAIYRNIKPVNPEITLEANPCSVDYNYLKSLKDIGFNRISFGVQSLVDSELHKLGRTHNSKTAINAVINANKAGFENISCDIMLGIIGQTNKSLTETINKMAELPVTHISSYMLKIEPHTPYNNKVITSQLPDEDFVCDMYELTQTLLSQKGFNQYEISNFSKQGFESRHNLKYWRCQEYIGIGPSAHSFYNGKRFYVPSDLDRFINNDTQTEIINEPHPHSFEEYAMLKLRLSEGLSFKEIRSFNIDVQKLLEKAQPLAKAGLLHISESGIRITPKGFLVSNEIIVQLVM